MLTYAEYITAIYSGVLYPLGRGFESELASFSSCSAHLDVSFINLYTD